MLGLVGGEAVDITMGKEAFYKGLKASEVIVMKVLRVALKTLQYKAHFGMCREFFDGADRVEDLSTQLGFLGCGYALTFGAAVDGCREVGQLLVHLFCEYHR